MLRCEVIRRASRARTRRDALLVVFGVSARGSVGGISATGMGWTAAPRLGSSAMVTSSG
ncbi:hypothetical protein MANY_09160 [Mycolicibacterium anyangense]|uniref:Uncharacterized protein n=1 Tax=Mycolicibacterium anyangense TaxID=1431246 RepID=A0A6N4W3J7_9MYCO|nr:hypothetical protein MANY_09160 [Mycolicibacterium anyangense]